MDQYRRHLVNIDLDSTDFWKEYGYYGKVMDTDPPSNEANFLRRRIQYVKPLMQCVKCGKWRQLRFHPKLLTQEIIPDNWYCELNTDTSKQK